jgi:hypothetical protein
MILAIPTRPYAHELIRTGSSSGVGGSSSKNERRQPLAVARPNTGSTAAVRASRIALVPCNTWRPLISCYSHSNRRACLLVRYWHILNESRTPIVLLDAQSRIPIDVVASPR